MKIKLFCLILIIYFGVFATLEINDHVNSENGTETDSSDKCSADEIIEKMLDIFTPEDFEEGKENIKSDINSFKEILPVMTRFKEFGHNVSQKMSEFSQRINNRMSESLMTIDLPTDCMTSLVRIMSAAKNGELWALKFFEAQPRPMNGLVELSGLPIGNYDQCLSIESPEEVDKPKIYGRYCGVDVEPYLIFDQKQYPRELFGDGMNSKFMNDMFNHLLMSSKKRTYEDWLTVIGFVEIYLFNSVKVINGICLPSTCSPNDVSKAINEMIYPITRIPFKMSDECEYVGKPIPLNTYHIVSIVGLGSVFVVFLLSSIIDCMPKTSIISKTFEKSSLDFYIKCFSFKRNTESVFKLKTYRKFKALDGFRAILTFYVVLLHNYEFGLLFFFTKNHYLSAAYEMVLDYKNMFLLNILLMDNFMIISAFLLGNTVLSRLEQSKGNFNYLNYLLFRFLRMMPILICGLFCTFLFEFVGDGPLWNIVKLYFIGPCYDKWYKPLLLYNNMQHYPKNSTILSSIQCMAITWYSSCDFQVYALAPIAFILLYKKPKWGVIWALVLLLVSVATPVFNRFVMDLPHVYEIFTHPNYKKVTTGWSTHYWGPINYFQTYIIGILIAFVVRNKPNVYLGGRIGETIIWITTSSMSFGLLYWQRNFVMPGYPFEGLLGFELHVYLIFHKLVYLSGFGWLIFACATGRGGFVNEMLGWKGFKVVDNVALEIYIMHVFLFVYRIGARRELITVTDYYVWTCTAFDFLIGYVLAVITALVVTRPFANMTMALMKPQRKTKPLTEEINGNDSNIGQSLQKGVLVINEKDIKDMNVIFDSKDKIVYRL